MKLISLKKYLLFATFFVFCTQTLFSQSEYNKWVFGIGMVAVDFYPFETEGNGNRVGFFDEITNAEDHWNIGGPKLHATRHIWKGLSVEGAFSYNTLTRFGDTETEKTAYTSFDLNAQYALLKAENNFNIALSVGGGYTGAYNSGATFNAGGNVNLWVSDNFGFNVQGLFKYNSPDFSLAPHMYYGFSLVYRTGGRFKSNSGRAKRFMWRNGR